MVWQGGEARQDGKTCENADERILGTAAWKLTAAMGVDDVEVKRAVMLTMSGRAGLVVGVSVIVRSCAL